MAINHFVKLTKPEKSSVFDIYWRFAVKRFEVFEKRINNPIGPWTDDPILNKHRFTNVFRASDRVSQYLINLQYQSDNLENVFFKTMLFKFFNKIDTYNYLDKNLENINHRQFSFEKYNNLLNARMAELHSIYSAAYIMPSAGSVFGFKSKHSNHLALLEKMMKDRLYVQITRCKSLEEVYNLLLSYPSLGSFLAFQYTIDINYSELTDFSEMDFVVAGPGAKNGIIKCFKSIGDYTYSDIIKLMADNQELECEKLELISPNLWGRRLQLIDCQNLFCEVDKYLRVKNPELVIGSGRKRIKQNFKNAKDPINYFFPPKWKINFKINQECRKITNEDIYS